jgi:hypothetical protein
LAAAAIFVMLKPRYGKPQFLFLGFLLPIVLMRLLPARIVTDAPLFASIALTAAFCGWLAVVLIEFEVARFLARRRSGKP